MREIKFRAWDKKRKELLPVAVISIMGNAIKITSDWQPISSVELMQSTGLTDKNGKEIYEGDICKVLDRDWPSQLDSFPELNHQQYLDSISSICEVIWDKGSFWLNQLKGKGYYYPRVSYGSNRDVFEVIGNVWENPELLK